MPQRRSREAVNGLDARKVLLLVVFFAVGIGFWEVPYLWPLKMLVVMIHETGHAVTSLLVGGSVTKLVVSANQSGQCLSAIPDAFFPKVLVYSAGYVGSALVASLLLLLTFRYQARRVVLGAASVWLTATAFIYAGDLFTLAFCLGTAILLGAAAAFLPDFAVEVTNLFLAAFASLYVLMDLKDDLWDGRVRAMSDAALLAKTTMFPSIFWAFAWTAFSLGLLGMATWGSIQHRRSPSLL